MPKAHWRGREARRRQTLAASLVAAVLIAGGCGGSKQASSDADGSTPASTSTGASVTIETFMFTPRLLRVHVGDTVTWTNNDSILHTVTAGSREYQPGNSGEVTATRKDGTFDMQLDGRGATATYTVTTAGTFHYFCERHPGMEADIEVS